MLSFDVKLNHEMSFSYPFPLEKKGILTLVIRGEGGVMSNILDRYRHVYIFLIRRQKQNF